MTDRPLRIGHLIGSLHAGGAERQVINLLNELPAGQGVVLTLTKRAGPLARELRPGREVMPGAVRWGTLPFDMWRLVFNLRSLKLDVLQTHMFWANLAGVVAGRLAGIPVIVTTEHGWDEWKGRGAHWIERYLISKLADTRICVSDGIRQLRHAVDGIHLENLCVISNGTPVRKKKELRDRSPVVLGTLGRLVEAKDYSTLIRVAKLLREEGVVFRLEIVGEGHERKRLLSEIDEHQLAGIVELPGFSADVQACLERFDIYVSSSIREGQPLSLLEAMSVGLPIVATNVGGIPSTVTDGKEAMLVPSGDPEAMSAALATVIRDVPLRRRLGEAARERLIKDFSVSASLRRHLEVYEAILEQKRR